LILSGDKSMQALTTQPAQISHTERLTQAGQAANTAAARNIFEGYRLRKAPNTTRRHYADLALFETFLNRNGVPASGLHDNPQAWRGVTWGLVEAFKVWMLQEGYAIGSINGRLSTVRKYAELAAKAEAIEPQSAMLIGSVQGYANKERKHIDDKRRADGIGTRTGAKKAEAVTIPQDIAEALKAQPNAPQGRRDALLMCLLLDHGFRVGEAAILTRSSFDVKAGTLTFYRPKVSKHQTHKLTRDTRRAAIAYIAQDAPAEGILWRRSCKGTSKLSSPMSPASAERALTKRVELLGRHAGLEGLSAHDCRHYWATYEANNGTPVNRLMDAGGWSSPAMPLRYIEVAHIANEGTARIKSR
jgi:integrase